MMSGASERKEKVVCVTGASGYIASWLMKLLHQRGYSVRATVRNPDDPTKTEHLLALDGAKERLRLFKAELLDQGAFNPVINGCDGVFHPASPVFFAADDPKFWCILVVGSQTYPNTSIRYEDVRDVAQSHVLAFENPSASGRYFLVATVTHCLEVLDILCNFYPTMTLPEKCEAEQPFAGTYQVPSVYHVSREKAEGLGVKFTPVEVSIRDTIESFKEKGFLQI